MDDGARQAVHYIAAGPNTSHLKHGLPASMYSGRRSAAYDKERAALLTWLLQQPAVLLNINFEDAWWQTPVHLCILSGSIEVLDVILNNSRLVKGKQEARLDAVDDMGRTPLDLAVLTQQWHIVNRLVSAGALQTAGALRQAREDLKEILPESTCLRLQLDNVSMQQYIAPQAASKLPFGLGKLMHRVLGVDSFYDRELDTHINNSQSASHTHCACPQVLEDNQAVFQHRQEAIEHIMYTCSVDQLTALKLFRESGFALDKAISIFFSQQQQSPRVTGNGEEGQLKNAGGCIVCFEECISCKIHTDCDHKVCNNCWRGIIKARTDDGDVHMVRCPHPNCFAVPPAYEIEMLLTRQQWAKFEQLLAVRYVDSSPLVRWCPGSGCGRSVALKGEDAAIVLNGYGLEVSCSCGQQFCWNCTGDPHEPASCKQIQEWSKIVPQTVEERSKEWLQKCTKKCTGCGASIQRNGGCNHMICPVCRHHFCWACGGDWNLHGPLSGGFYHCNRLPPPSINQGRQIVGKVVKSLHQVAKKYLYNLEFYIQKHDQHVHNRTEFEGVAFRLRQLLELGIPKESKIKQDEGNQKFIPTCCCMGITSPSLRSKFKQSERYNVEPEYKRCQKEQQKQEVEQQHEQSDIMQESFDYFDRWTRQVEGSRHMLRNCYIMLYFMCGGVRRRYLEHLIHRLELIIDLLVIPIQQAPHKLSMTTNRSNNNIINRTKHGLKWCQIALFGFDFGATLIETIWGNQNVSMDGSQLKDQFYYALALQERSELIIKLIDAAQNFGQQIRAGAKEGLFIQNNTKYAWLDKMIAGFNDDTQLNDDNIDDNFED